MTAIARPEPSEHAEFYAGYVAEVPDGSILEILEAQRRSTAELLAGVDEERALYRYADGKWSIKEIVGHLADAERVFAYRALRAARGDRTPLPGFDHDAYIANAGFDRRPLTALAAELEAVRFATLELFGGLSPEEVARRGIANGTEFSVRALAWIIAGHERHHVLVLAERYGLTAS